MRPTRVDWIATRRFSTMESDWGCGLDMVGASRVSQSKAKPSSYNLMQRPAIEINVRSVGRQGNLGENAARKGVGS